MTTRAELKAKWTARVCEGRLLNALVPLERVAADVLADLTRVDEVENDVLSIREAARASGVNPLAHKLAALVVSSFLAGLAGATFALHQASFYAQFAFEPTWTFDAVLITFIGGVGTVLGPLIGAIFYIVVREQLRKLD